MPDPITLQLVPTGHTVEVIPGRKIAQLLPREAVPKYGAVRLQRLSDGTYMPTLETHTQLVRLSDTTARRLGLDIDYRSLLRLTLAGFIKSKRPTPNKILIDVGSLFDHLRATEAPGFWTRDRIAAYRTGIGYADTDEYEMNLKG